MSRSTDKRSETRPREPWRGARARSIVATGEAPRRVDRGDGPLLMSSQRARRGTADNESSSASTAAFAALLGCLPHSSAGSAAASHAAAHLLLTELLAEEDAGGDSASWLHERGVGIATAHAAHWDAWHELPSCDELSDENSVLRDATSSELPPPPCAPRLRFAGCAEPNGAMEAAVLAAPAQLCGGTLIDRAHGGAHGDEGVLLDLLSYDAGTQTFVAMYDDGAIATLSHDEIRRLHRMRFVIEEAS